MLSVEHEIGKTRGLMGEYYCQHIVHSLKCLQINCIQNHNISMAYKPLLMDTLLRVLVHKQLAVELNGNSLYLYLWLVAFFLKKYIFMIWIYSNYLAIITHTKQFFNTFDVRW